MYTLKVKPENGTLYEVTHDYNEFRITEIEGLDPPMNTVNVTTGLFDGGIFNSSRLQPRNLVISGVLRGDIATSRRKLYALFPQKSSVEIFFSDGVLNLKTTGYVENYDCSPFLFPSGFGISVICPDSYWHALTDAEFSIESGTPVTITNPGNAAVGFRCVLEFSADDPPAVTLGEASATLTAVYPYQKNLMLYPVWDGDPVADDFDPVTQKITELKLGGVDFTARISSVEKITKQDDISGTNAQTMIRVEMTGNVFSKGTYSIDYTIASVEGGSMETVEINSYASTGVYEEYGGTGYEVWFYDVRPGENFDSSTDAYRVYMQRSGSSVWEDLTSQCSLHTKSGTPQFLYALFGFNPTVVGYAKGKLVIYHDADGADIRSTLQLRTFGGTRNPSADWYANLYSSVPVGFDSSADVPYINGNRITAADISDCYVVSGGVTTQYSIVYGDPADSVAFRYVYSLSSADIRTYTDDQIDAGLMGVFFTRGVMLENSSGGWIYFKNSRFQTGDVVEISTVSGDIYAKITEREGSSADISVMWDAYKNSRFFELKPGTNTLELSAGSGGEYLSGEISAGWLYTGV